MSFMLYIRTPPSLESDFSKKSAFSFLLRIVPTDSNVGTKTQSNLDLNLSSRPFWFL